MNNDTDYEDEAFEGEVLKGDTSTYNFGNVKRPKNVKLSVKARKFAKAYKEGETMGNGTKSAIKAGYSKVSAHVTANRLLKDSKVLAILNESVEEAERVISDLMYDENPQIRLAASKEVLDRTVGKAIQRSESVHVNVTVESMLNDPDS